MESKESLVTYLEIELDDDVFRKYPLLWNVSMIQDVEENKKVVVEGTLKNPGVDICFLAGYLDKRKMTCKDSVTVPVKIGKKTYEIPYKLIRKMVFRAK